MVGGYKFISLRETFSRSRKDLDLRFEVDYQDPRGTTIYREELMDGLLKFEVKHSKMGRALEWKDGRTDVLNPERIGQRMM